MTPCPREEEMDASAMPVEPEVPSMIIPCVLELFTAVKMAAWMFGGTIANELCIEVGLLLLQSVSLREVVFNLLPNR